MLDKQKICLLSGERETAIVEHVHRRPGAVTRSVWQQSEDGLLHNEVAVQLGKQEKNLPCLFCRGSKLAWSSCARVAISAAMVTAAGRRWSARGMSKVSLLWKKAKCFGRWLLGSKHARPPALLGWQIPAALANPRLAAADFPCSGPEERSKEACHMTRPSPAEHATPSLSLVFLLRRL